MLERLVKESNTIPTSTLWKLLFWPKVLVGRGVFQQKYIAVERGVASSLRKLAELSRHDLACTTVRGCSLNTFLALS